MCLWLIILRLVFRRVKGDALDQITLTTANRDGDYVTLYKMPETTGFSNNAAGVEQYRQICENYHPDVKMVGCGTDSYHCIPEENCISMPSSWGCNMLYGLHSATGWSNIVALQEDGRNHLYAYGGGRHQPSVGNSYYAVCGSVGPVSSRPGYFFTMTGDCDVQGDCVSSRNYPSVHENHESCTVTMLQDVIVTPGNLFNLETCCDHLMIGGVDVESSNAVPSSLSAGDVFSWTSDFSVTREGWQLCFSVLGYVDNSSCQWHAVNNMNKVINDNQFFGFECPANQIISDLRLEGYGARSVLENNPTAILCCELGGYSVVTNTCVDSYSTADGILEAAICEGNSAMAAIYDLSDPVLEQSQWQYQATKGIKCCEIEFDTSYGHNLDLGIDRSQCEIISHSNQMGSFDVSCPADMVLVEIRDNDPAHGVQEVHEIECCRVSRATAPTKAPTVTPTTSQPSSAPTSSCYHCLIGVHGEEVRDQDDFVREIEACLSHCCV